MSLELFANRSVPPPPRVGVYGTVLADPPWPEHGGGAIKRGADRHYDLMSVDDIALLPVTFWAATDAHLYLWVTNNYLEDGLSVLRAWGFRYVTTITWLKERHGQPQIGLGQYFRGVTEHCLFGVRGVIPYRTKENGQRAQGVTGFVSARQEHSVKPVELRSMVELVSPGPRLEMFARREFEGWDAWGNEVGA